MKENQFPTLNPVFEAPRESLLLEKIASFDWSDEEPMTKIG
jgi:hypothetical protein